MSVRIRRELDDDRDAIAEINRDAFEGLEEARLVNELREGGFARVSLVAELNGQLVGHILFSDLAIVSDSRTWPAVALAPLAVRPAFQRQGIGQLLTAHGLAACRGEGIRIAIVLGHPAFYGRFGFSAKLAVPLESPFAGEAFMALELESDALDGVAGRVRYAAPFGVFA